MAIAQTPSPLSNVISSKTYNALWYQSTGDTSEVAISKATAAAATDGAPFVYIPAALFPYNINLVTTSPLVSYIQESSVLAGYGTPEGVYAAPVGWLYQQLDTADLWQKASGTGTTGWVEIVGALSNSITSIQSVTGRYQEYRVELIDSTGATINDGSPLNTPLAAFSRFKPGEASSAGVFRQTGATTPTNAQGTYRETDGRRYFSSEPGVNQGVNWAFRPNTLLNSAFSDFRDVYGTTTSTPTSKVPTLFATSWMAWCRKKNAGDSSHARHTFGFADNTILFPSRGVARCGLIGDGLGGYRFGSVNCPDGGAAGDNSATDIDANAVQPAELTNANLGTKLFHVRIKLVPPTPTSPGQWGAYLNGTLVATFTNTANFVRGSGQTNHNYARIEPSILNYGDAAIAVPGLMFSDIRLWIEEDLTLV